MACRRAADHEGVYEPNRSKAALTSGHRWNEYKSIRIRLRFRQASGNQNPQCPSRPGPFVSKRLTSMILPPFRTARTIRFEQGELPDRVARVLQRAVQQADPLPRILGFEREPQLVDGRVHLAAVRVIIIRVLPRHAVFPPYG